MPARLHEEHGFIYEDDASGKHGMPMGGLGTNTLNLDRTGKFQDITLQNNIAGSLKPTPVQNFFSVFVETGATGAGRLLQKDPASPLPGVEHVRYHGHFPFADLTYADPALPCKVTLRAFSPFVPFSPEESSLPLAFFRFTVENPTRDRMRATVAFSWQNDIAEHPFTKGKAPRGNLNLHAETEAWNGVLMSTRRPAMKGSEYLLAGLKTPCVAFSAVADWWRHTRRSFAPNLAADAHPGMTGTHVMKQSGEPIRQWEHFLRSGQLPPETDQEDGYGMHTYHCPVGAVAGAVELAPGESRDVEFMLAWFFPQYYGDYGRALTWMGHQYARRFPGGTRDVATWSAPRRENLTIRSAAWRTLIDESSLPPTVRKLMVNLLYLIPRVTHWLEDGRFMTYESPSCVNMQTANWAPWSALFPDLDASWCRSIAALQLPSGEFPVFLGVCECDNPVYWSGTALPGYASMACWSWQTSGRSDLLTDFYPALKRYMNYMVQSDEDGDGIPELHGVDHGFDTWHWT